MGLRSKATDHITMLFKTGRSTQDSPKGSREERLVRDALSTVDPERERFVEELKRAVWDGTYEPDAGEVADAIIAERLSDRQPES
jgi:anti-sigma28 factor (negative regulator of flagellin synthesis)